MYTFFGATCPLHRVGVYVQDIFKDTSTSVESKCVLKDTLLWDQTYTCQLLVYDTRFCNAQSLKEGVR
jgi:hypothetical protein